MVTESDDIMAYYARRAGQYERVYARPERQQELAVLRELLPPWFAGHAVLEVACGTGYWTRVISTRARSVLAVDNGAEVLQVARGRSYGTCDVRFLQADAYSLAGIEGEFTAGFAAFWWSHVPKGRRGEFLRSLHARMPAGAPVVLLDNVYVPGSSSPQAGSEDEEGNTFSIRRLDDGSQWRVLKNFPTEAELRADISPFAGELAYGALKHYWWARYAVSRP